MELDCHFKHTLAALDQCKGAGALHDFPGANEVTARLNAAIWTIKARIKELSEPDGPLTLPISQSVATARKVARIKLEEDAFAAVRETFEDFKQSIFLDWLAASSNIDNSARRQELLDALEKVEDQWLVQSLESEHSAIQLEKARSTFALARSIGASLHEIQTALNRSDGTTDGQTLLPDGREPDRLIVSKIRRHMRFVTEECQQQQAAVDKMIETQLPWIKPLRSVPVEDSASSDYNSGPQDFVSEVTPADSTPDHDSPVENEAPEPSGLGGILGAEPNMSVAYPSRRFRGRLVVDTKKCYQEEMMLDYLTNINRGGRRPAAAVVVPPEAPKVFSFRPEVVPPAPAAPAAAAAAPEHGLKQYGRRIGRMSICPQMQSSMAKVVSEFDGLEESYIAS